MCGFFLTFDFGCVFSHYASFAFEFCLFGVMSSSVPHGHIFDVLYLPITYLSPLPSTIVFPLYKKEVMLPFILNIYASCTCSPRNHNSLISDPFYGVGCRAHDEGGHMLACSVHPASDTYLTMTESIYGTSYYQNAPYCGMEWCYVENPEECADAVESIVPVSVQGNNRSTVPLYYSYGACGSVDYFTRKCPCTMIDGRIYADESVSDEFLSKSLKKWYRSGQEVTYDDIIKVPGNGFCESNHARTTIAPYDPNPFLYLRYVTGTNHNPFSSQSFCYVKETCPLIKYADFVSDSNGLPLAYVSYQNCCGKDYTNIVYAQPYKPFVAANANPPGGSTDMRRYLETDPQFPSLRSLQQASESDSVHKLKWALHLDACSYECVARSPCVAWLLHHRWLFELGDVVTIGVEGIMHVDSGILIKWATFANNGTRTLVVLRPDVIRGTSETLVINMNSTQTATFDVASVTYSMDANVTVGGQFATLTTPLGIITVESLTAGTCYMIGKDFEITESFSQPENELVFRGNVSAIEVVPVASSETVQSAWSSLLRFNSLYDRFLTREVTIGEDAVASMTSLPYIISVVLLNAGEYDKASRIVEDPDATTIAKLSIVMRDTTNYQTRRIVPNAYRIEIPKFFDCQRGVTESDSTLVNKDEWSECPEAFKKSGYHATNTATDKRLLFGAVNIGETGWLEDYNRLCKEMNRVQTVYNGTHLFVSFSYTINSNNRESVRQTNSFKYCRSPILPGRLHCGLLTVAYRIVFSILNKAPIRDNQTSICTLLTEGLSCENEPILVIGGVSQGGSVTAIVVMLMDYILFHAYDIDMTQSDLRIRIWIPSAAGDKTFTKAYLSRFGRFTKSFSIANDFVAQSASFLFDNLDTETVVISPLGSCGQGETKFARDCTTACNINDIVSTISDCTQSAIQAIFTLGYDSLSTHISQAAISVGDFDEVDIVRTQPLSWVSSITAALGVVDELVEGVQTIFSPSKMCIFDYLQGSFQETVCFDHLSADPWLPTNGVYWRRYIKSLVYTSCLHTKLRLQIRIDAGDLSNDILDSWNALCCASATDPTTPEQLNFFGRDAVVPLPDQCRRAQ